MIMWDGWVDLMNSMVLVKKFYMHDWATAATDERALEQQYILP
jgi:hypothetical protein